MHTITLVSTIHKEIGKCNADELCEIIKKISPEIIFLEALEETYSNYQHAQFSSFGVYHKKLEIAAIQKYNFNTAFEYVPVLDSGLSNAFDKKYDVICENEEFQALIENFNSLASENGFQFLNSAESIRLQEEMRVFEHDILNDNLLYQIVSEDIDTYENSMMRNIYSFCKNTRFDTAIFMCGAAHRKSIIEKVAKFNSQEGMRINWLVFND